MSYVTPSNKICNYGTIVVGLSDHFLVFCTRKVTRGQINKHNTVEIRCMKITVLIPLLTSCLMQIGLVSTMLRMQMNHGAHSNQHFCLSLIV